MTSSVTLPAAGSLMGPSQHGQAAAAGPELLLDLRIRFVETGSGVRVETLEPIMALSMGLGTQPASAHSAAPIAPLGGQIDASRPPSQGTDLLQQFLKFPARIKDMLLANGGGGTLLGALAPPVAASTSAAPVAASPLPTDGLAVTLPAANSSPYLQQEQEQRPRYDHGQVSLCTAPSPSGVTRPDCALPRPGLCSHDQADQAGGRAGVEPRLPTRISRPRSRSRGWSSAEVDCTHRNDRSFAQSWSQSWSRSRSRSRSWSRNPHPPMNFVARDEYPFAPAQQQRKHTSRSWSRSRSRSRSHERERPRPESRYRSPYSHPARSPARSQTEPSFSSQSSRTSAPVALDAQPQASASLTKFEFRLSNLPPFETPGDIRRFESLFTSRRATAKIRRAKKSSTATLLINLLPSSVPRMVAMHVLRRSGYVIGGLPVRVEPMDSFSQWVTPSALNLPPLVVYLAVNPPQYPGTSSEELNRAIFNAFGVWPYMDRGLRPVPGTRLWYMYLTFDAPRGSNELKHLDELVAFGCKMRFSRIEDPRAFFANPKYVFDRCTALVEGDPDLAPLLNEDEGTA